MEFAYFQRTDSMNKAVALLALVTLVAGCKTTPPTPQEQSLTGMRCRIFATTKDISRDWVEYIREASDNGNPQCQIALGVLYEFGRGLPQDMGKAKALYESVAADDAAGYEQLARMAEEGSGQVADASEARRLYQRVQPGSAYSDARLARLMEEGRGGPQDLSGAMTHYLNASRYVGDTPWEGVQRVRAQGLAMTAEQVERYNTIWYESTGNSLSGTVGDMEFALKKQIKPGSASKPVTLEIKGKPGSLVPEIILVESSGNAAVDQAVLEAFGNYRFPAEPIMKAGQESWSSKLSVRAGLN
ncbi:sel1 repeat family protein [Pseudomonas sp. FW215-R2]|nr:sel1 repeat family protein [Pseudomonas sp. FW215-R2]PMX06553.1 sel1 repeat family protein [Pseudomonas sp. FW215-L1]PMX22603.1 sel1 repeat family protein [Pseudomonas sp. FW215-E1]PNA30404.1 sel1 repeat family protein [Pseudomonas sp. FW215-R4]